MEEIRFRNHFSVVFEHLLGFLTILVVLFIQNLDDLSEFIKLFENWKNGMSGTESLMMLLIPFGIILLALLIIGIQINVWRKTWFIITKETIIEDRNTLIKVHNTIGIRNISNVNLEQSLTGKILGTCRVKLDTNSLSTANKTDLKIVLKKQDALTIQKQILAMVNKNRDKS